MEGWKDLSTYGAVLIADSLGAVGWEGTWVSVCGDRGGRVGRS